MAAPLGWEFHVSGIGVGLRDGIAFRAKAIKVKSDGFTHVLFDFVTGRTCRDAA